LVGTIGEDHGVEDTIQWHLRTHFPQSILINSELSALYYILSHPTLSIMPTQKEGWLKGAHLWFNFRELPAPTARQAAKSKINPEKQTA
jgi:hypothetical protein